MRRSRGIKARKSAIAFVVEGETEMWYLQMLKKNEEREQKIQINIKPEIPQDSKLEDQYKLVLELAEEYNSVHQNLDLSTKNNLLFAFLILTNKLLSLTRYICINNM